MFNMVTMILMAPRIEDIPRRCTAKISRSPPSWTLPELPTMESGGYMVQPASGVPGTTMLSSSRLAAKGRIQNPQLLMRGSAMSGAPIIMGMSQLASPAKAGMTAPKTITSPWMVTNWLKARGSMNWIPGANSSSRKAIAWLPANTNMSAAKTRYRVPMSLWLVVNTQRLSPVGCSSCAA